MQELIKRNIQLEKIKKNIEIAHSLRIHSHGFFMIGFHGETLEEMKMTVEFMVSSKLHSSALFVVMLFGGTELGAIAKEMGKVPVSDFSMSYHTQKFVNLTNVPSEEANRIRRQALIRFYLDPFWLFVLVRDFPKKRELGKLVMVFFRRLWPSCAWASIFTPYPSNQLTEYAIQNGYFGGNSDTVSYSFYSHSVMDFSSPRERRMFTNLHRLFAILVEWPFLGGYARMLCAMPLTPVYVIFYRLLYGYTNRCRIYPYPVSLRASLIGFVRFFRKDRS
jgi:hypothetical protein